MAKTNCGCEHVINKYSDAERILLKASGRDYESVKVDLYNSYDQKVTPQEPWQKDLLEAVRKWQHPKPPNPDQAYIDVAEDFFKIWEQVKDSPHEFLVAAEFHYFQSVTIPDLESVLPSDLSGRCHCADYKKTKNKTSLKEMRVKIDSILREYPWNKEGSEYPNNIRGWYSLGYYLIARGDHKRAELAFRRAIECAYEDECPLYTTESDKKGFLFKGNCEHGFSTCWALGAWAGLSYVDNYKAVYEMDMNKQRLLLTNAHVRLKGLFQDSNSELEGGPIDWLYRTCLLEVWRWKKGTHEK